MSETRKARPDANADLLARVRAAARQEQFLEVVSAEEARARFERHLDLSPLAAETVPLAAALTRVLAHDVVAPVDAPPFDRSNVDGFALRAADTAGAGDGNAENLPAQCRSDRLRRCAGARSGARHRHRHRHRRRDPARRRRRGDDRADRTDRGDGAPRDRSAPRRRARAIHLLCRLRHRARRNAAAARHAHRLARDRHARGLRARASRCGAAAESGGALDRRRAGRAGRAAEAGGVYDSNGAIIAAAIVEAGGEPVPLARFPTTRRRWKRPCARRWRAATWWCCRAAPRKAPAICRTASCRGSASPASWCTASRSSPASRFASASIGDKPIVVLPGFPTSAIFTFHAFVAPVIRARAGLPPEAARNDHRARAGAHRLRTRPQGIRAGVADRRATTARSRFRPAKAPARSPASRRPTASSRSTRSPPRSMPTAAQK